jgi:hypothetical protein
MFLFPVSLFQMKKTSEYLKNSVAIVKNAMKAALALTDFQII